MGTIKEIEDLHELAKLHDGGYGKSLTSLARERDFTAQTLGVRLVDLGYLATSAEERRRRKRRGLGWFPVEEIVERCLDEGESAASVTMDLVGRGFPLRQHIVEEVLAKAVLRRMQQKRDRRRRLDRTKIAQGSRVVSS